MATSSRGVVFDVASVLVFTNSNEPVPATGFAVHAMPQVSKRVLVCAVCGPSLKGVGQGWSRNGDLWLYPESPRGARTHFDRSLISSCTS